MYVVGLNTYGGPEVLHPLELPDPHAKAGQVRVGVQAAGINPVDVMVRDGSLAGWFADAQPPFVPGMDIAGTIDEIGEGVDPQLQIFVGQQVVGVVDNFGSYGGYSQYVCLPAASVIPQPVGITTLKAASFLMNALTARNALENLRLATGSTVLVTGAAGAVGAYTVALANHEGLKPIAVASPQDETFLLSTGAAQVIERGPDAAERIRKIFSAGVDAAGLGQDIVPAVRDAGTIITPRPGDDAVFDRGVTPRFVNVRERVTDRAAIARLGEQVASGLLAVRVAGTFPAVEAAAAHRRLAGGGLRGRLILDFAGL